MRVLSVSLRVRHGYVVVKGEVGMAVAFSKILFLFGYWRGEFCAEVLCSHWD